MVSVLIVDDHAMLGEALASSLESEDGITIVGLARTAAAGREVVREHAPDVILMDYRLPGTNGIDEARSILRESPGTRVIILTGYSDSVLFSRAVLAGCCGVIDKRRSVADVARAVRAARAGCTVLQPSLASATISGEEDCSQGVMANDAQLDPPVTITRRELDVLKLMSEGMNNPQIARALHVSLSTARNHVHNVIGKMTRSDDGVRHTRTEAVTRAHRQGLL